MPVHHSIINYYALFYFMYFPQCRIDYKQCYSAHRQSPSQHTMQQYIDAHNAYVQQMHATNAMLEAYHCDTMPQLMEELEEIYTDLCNTVAESVLQGADAITAKVRIACCILYRLLLYKHAKFYSTCTSYLYNFLCFIQKISYNFLVQNVGQRPISPLRLDGGSL